MGDLRSTHEQGQEALAQRSREVYGIGSPTRSRASVCIISVKIVLSRLSQ